MKLLFAANRFPYPPFRGDKLKIFHLARILSKQHELHLITFLQDESDRQYLPELEKYFTRIELVSLPKIKSLMQLPHGLKDKNPFQIHYFHNYEMEQRINQLLKEETYDAVHVQHLRMAPYWENRKSLPRILDLPDAYSLYWQRRVEAASGIKKWLTVVEQKRVYLYEKTYSNFDLTLVCSREDADYLKKEHGLKKVAILPNGVDISTFSDQKHDYSQNKNILFTGNMDYAPNVDAVNYFVKEIFPKIKSGHPDVRFIIGGQNPVKKVSDLASNDIEVTGFVPDLSQLYRKAAIVVAPLRFGAGTQNKVLEGMAMGIPIVSGKVGFAGLNIESGEGVFLAETADLFVYQCNKLLDDEQLRAETGAKGRSVILNHFSWEAIGNQLENYFERIIHETPKN